MSHRGGLSFEYHYLENWRMGAKLPFALGHRNYLGCLG